MAFSKTHSKHVTTRGELWIFNLAHQDYLLVHNDDQIDNIMRAVVSPKILKYN